MQHFVLEVRHVVRSVTILLAYYKYVHVKLKLLKLELPEQYQACHNVQVLKLQLEQYQGCEKNSKRRERTNGQEDDDETF